MDKPAQKSVAPPTSPRPLPQGALGGKSLECFAWSAAHDDDAEFFRRYGERVEFMCTWHADDPLAQDAIERLKKLAK